MGVGDYLEVCVKIAIVEYKQGAAFCCGFFLRRQTPPVQHFLLSTVNRTSAGDFSLLHHVHIIYYMCAVNWQGKPPVYRFLSTGKSDTRQGVPKRVLTFRAVSIVGAVYTSPPHGTTRVLQVVVVVVAVVVVVVIDVGKSTNSGQSPVKYIAPTKYRIRAAQSVPVSSVPPQEHGTVYAKIILVDLITRCFVRLDYRLWYIDLIFG